MTSNSPKPQTLAYVASTAALLCFLISLVTYSASGHFDHEVLGVIAALSTIALGALALLAQKIKSYAAQSRLDEEAVAELKEQLLGLSANISEMQKRDKAIIEKAVDVICVIDVDAQFLSVSPSAERAWGYSIDFLIGRKLTDLVVSEDATKTLELVLGAQQSITKISFENRLKHKNGDWLDFEWTAHWSATDNGLFCIAHDITERKKTEALLQESERQLRTTIEAMPVGVVSATQFGMIEFANTSMQTFTGVRLDQLLGTQVADFISSAQRESYLHYFTECKIAGAHLQPIESEIKTSTGAMMPVEVSVTTFTVQSINKCLITFADITQRKEVERLRREFVAMVNHDLRTPLTSITGLMKRVEDGTYGDLAPAGKELCSLASLELERLMRLVNELLDLDKLESGNLQVQTDEVAALDIIEASVSSIKAYAEIRKIKLTYPETELPCRADRTRIIQVMVNLLSNAIKFSPDESEIVIAVLETDGGVKFSIQDQGRGIPADKIATLFRRFQQVNPDDAVERAGSGLGLSICKALVEAHGGTIGCESLAPRGTVFWFCLPNQ
ncbi:MAG: PAS domain S-box protein [Candidatus Obscuribacterales bacterium]|nr:PAS domain S-box protein [Candidatus Obscuribacterales bacterium]